MKHIFTTILFILLFVSYSMSQTTIQQADSLYELRGEGFDTQTLLANNTNIDSAISLYKEILETATGVEKEKATWKLIKAHYFKGRYTTNDSEEKKRIYDLGKELGEKGLEEFPDSPGINLFSAIVWGVWGEEYGLFKAAKEGVAGKLKERSEKVIKIDPDFDEAGGYRILGRVYFKAPKIWPILRWPSKKKAIEILEKGNGRAPANLFTKKFLAEALYAEKNKDRAKKIMKAILEVTETRQGIVEDAVLKNNVKNILAEWDK